MAPSKQQPQPWHHAPSPWTLLWLAISLPLVIWDTGYVLGRPHTMEGGALHWPFYTPYKLYGEIDHVYGWKAFHSRNGFTSAQASVNVVETALYLVYLWTWYFSSKATSSVNGSMSRVLSGRAGAKAVLLGFSAAVMTFGKTVLYGANEYYSGFDNVGHNPPLNLIFLYIIPNGAWIVGSAYMIWSIGGEILNGLELASSRAKNE